jgi:hypothetical protein
MRCNQLTGCGLDFHAEATAGLPLSAFVGRAHVRIRIKCESRGFFRAAKVETLIKRFTTETTRGETVLTSEVRSKIGPCGALQKVAWAGGRALAERGKRQLSAVTGNVAHPIQPWLRRLVGRVWITAFAPLRPGSFVLQNPL